MSEALKLAEMLARTPRILIIDDEPIIHHVFGRLKDYYDLEVAAAHTPEEGLRLIAHNKYDAIFIDMKFDGALDGMDVIRALNISDSQATVIVMSGSINLHDVMVEANQLGIVSFMAKPVVFTTQLLASVLRRLHIRLAPQKPESGNVGAESI